MGQIHTNKHKYFNTFKDVIYTNKYYHFNNKVYKKKEWISKITRTINIKKNNEIMISCPNDLNHSIIKNYFLLNVFESTFMANNLPSAIFLIISLISFSLPLINEHSRNFRLYDFNNKVDSYFNFLGIVLIIIATVMFVFSKVLKIRYFYSDKHNNSGYTLLKNKTFHLIIEKLDKMIEKEAISFSKIENEMVKIREINRFDLNDYYKFAKNPNVCKYLMWDNFKNIKEAYQNILDQEKNYENKLYYRLGIIEKKNNKLIGYIGLSKYDYSLKTCQIVYAISEEYWNKGYTSQAVKLFLEYLIANNKEIIYAGHVLENINSGKVLLKNGFVRDISRDQQLVIHGVVKNIVGYTYKVK